MHLNNLSPLESLSVLSHTPAGEWRNVVIVKLTFDLEPCGPELQGQGWTHQLLLSEVQPPLAYVDDYHGEALKSSLRWESDTAPAKPRCDLVVLGTAHSPQGRPCRRFEARVKLTTPDRERPLPPRPAPLGYGMDLPAADEREWQKEAARARSRPIPGEILLDKRLQVTGARWLKRRMLPMRVFWWFVKVLSLGLFRRCPWVLTRPEALRALPIQYEYAYGGHNQVFASHSRSGRVPRRQGLPREEKDRMRRAWRRDRQDGVIAESGWEENYAGRGYMPAWQIKALAVKRLPAPQLEDPRYPFTAKAAWRAMEGKASGRYRLALRPQGLGPITRNWQPRLALGGTWDEAWRSSGKHYPQDHDLAFNNYAHPDLQCRHLAGNEILELTNLCDLKMPGVFLDQERNQWLRFQLPGYNPYLLVVIEPESRRVTLLQRASIPVEPEPFEVELRLAPPGAVPAAQQGESEPEWSIPELS